VWSSEGAVATQCPVSTASGNPEAWLELFAIWTSGSVNPSAEWWAKDVDAMTVLANEARRISGHERA
jgi:hypothetical protein